MPRNTDRPAGRATPSLRDVAALAGVSFGTVSNVLNHPAKVSPRTAQRVYLAIDRLGYVRNDAARQLRQGRNRSIGLLVLDVRNPFFTDVARGVEEVIDREQRGVLLANSDENPGREARYLDLFEEQRVDGILISPVGDVLHRLGQIRARGISVVLVDRLASTDNFASVAVDDVAGGQLAMEHLLAIGRRRVAFVGGPRSIEQVANRLRGARITARGAGLGVDDRYELPAMNAQGADVLGREIARLPADERPDAVFAANDLIAIGLLQAFSMAGLAVPDDIALIGYDDIDYAALAAVPLSSIRQPAREMGHRAAELLLNEIEVAGDASTREHVVFEPELVVRASTVGH